MSRKPKKRHYGDYTKIIDGNLYAVVNLRQPDGKYKKKHKKVVDKTSALQWALKELEKHKKGSSIDESLTFAEFAEWYAEEFLHKPNFEKGLKVSGVRDYKRLVNKLAKMKLFFAARKMKDFDESDLRRWAKHRRETDKILTATLNRDFAFLKTMLRRGKRFKRIENVPEFDINSAAENERERVMSFEEEKRILAACVDTEIIKVKSRAGNSYEMEIDAKRGHLKTVIILALDTAMRLNEIFSLSWQNVNFKEKTITVTAQNAKTQKARQIGMTDRVYAELKKLSANTKQEKVFDQKNPKRAFRTACLRAGIEGLHFHDLRHTAITRMIRAGIPHTEVMKISGHTQMKTFLRYLNLTGESVQSNAKQLAEFLKKNS
ncbi:MAG: tyrosine-type recombinase/integrase [Pyrinomonadaceae bacterium]